MMPAPFEVIPTDQGYSWQLIGGCGRTLVYSAAVYPSDHAAAEAARAARTRFATIAKEVDANG